MLWQPEHLVEILPWKKWKGTLVCQVRAQQCSNMECVTTSWRKETLRLQLESENSALEIACSACPNDWFKSRLDCKEKKLISNGIFCQSKSAKLLIAHLSSVLSTGNNELVTQLKQKKIFINDTIHQMLFARLATRKMTFNYFEKCICNARMFVKAF